MNSLVDLLWGHKEPVPSRGRCVAMSRSGHLYVHPCDQPLPFFCKADAARIVYNKDCNSYNLS
jgi:hypothetical protein